MFDKIDKKLYILGRNQWYRKAINTTKENKIIQRNTYYQAKKRCILSRRSHLGIKEVKILTKSDAPEDIKMGVKTEFGVKVVEHKE